MERMFKWGGGLYISLKLINVNLDLMFFTCTESLSFAIEIHNKSMPIFVNLFIIIVYLKVIIDDINDNAEWLIVGFISFINDLEECHGQSTTIHCHPTLPFLHGSYLSDIQFEQQTY
jgi:hypothetical protein